MEKEFIPYEQALALKELGFNRKTLAQYNTYQGNEWILTFNFSEEGQYTGNGGPCVAPTFSQVFRWFREKHKLSGTPQYFTGGYYCYTINDMKDTEKSNRLFTEFETYEEAELACLIKLIEIVRNG